MKNLPRRKLRIYADTSVFGGCHDEEFREDSVRFIEHVSRGRIVLLVSEIVLRELENAPRDVLRIIERLDPGHVERFPLTREIQELRDAYLREGILSRKWADDAMHVAAATVARADAIVSWNFKHIVRLDKMKEYQRVNLHLGYGILTIITPKEVLPHD